MKELDVLKYQDWGFIFHPRSIQYNNKTERAIQINHETYNIFTTITIEELKYFTEKQFRKMLFRLIENAIEIQIKKEVK